VVYIPRQLLSDIGKGFLVRLVSIALALLLISGCASYGVVDNRPQTGDSDDQGYSFDTKGSRGAGDVALILAFSGGGTRAAALAYGVMLELRDTKLVIDGKPRRMLDEVDTITSVSGGSFTSAYYGLFGDRIFDDFEEVFLKRDLQSQLIYALFNPLRWFSSKGRTEIAIDAYQETVFHNKTYADLQRQDGPLIIINASDLGSGVRFSFIQEYFNLLCSDVDSYPVARAVAASSAVPVLFNPVVLQNYAGCDPDKLHWLAAARARLADNPELLKVVEGLHTYSQKDQRKYAHFVDGGITDNLGLRAIYEIVEVAGGVHAFMHSIGRKIPRYLVVISVNASTDPAPQMDLSNEQPSIEETVKSVSAVQLHRYNAATLELMKNTLPRWAKEMSTPEQTVQSHFIQLSFNDIDKPDLLHYFNLVTTSFDLSDEQVEKLIEAGRQLIRSDPEFQKLLALSGGTPAK
jgi:NTE family protein